jgi:hypothetical protein
MGKKCCKDNGPKYVVTSTDNNGYIECDQFTKEEAEDEVADMLLDYDEGDILVYRLGKVDFVTTNKQVEVEIDD